MYIQIPQSKLRSSSLSREQAAASSGAVPGGTACAYPSWPRRSSLNSDSGRAEETTPSSFLSDDDLFPDVFEEESSADCTPITSTVGSPKAGKMEPEMISGSMLRQILAMHQTGGKPAAPKQKQKRRKSSTSSKKSRSSSVARTMSAIQETEE